MPTDVGVLDRDRLDVHGSAAPATRVDGTPMAEDRRFRVSSKVLDRMEESHEWIVPWELRRREYRF